MKSLLDKNNEQEENQLDHNIVQNEAAQTHFEDNRPETVLQAKLQEGMGSKTNANPLSVSQKNNKTGLPDQLKTGVEQLSGYSMDDVKVHYNSSEPAQLQAHAFAQGTDIHLAPGQEKHLPHESWHVVQQKQGRVKPTLQMKDRVNINDNTSLEKEADTMGEKVLEGNTYQLSNSQLGGMHSSVIQLRKVKCHVNWVTHLVKMVEGSLFNERAISFLENEVDNIELEYGDIVEVDTDTGIYSRRKSSQEKRDRKVEAQAEPNTLWFQVTKVNGVVQNPNIYIRAETFHEMSATPKTAKEEEESRVDASNYLYSMIPVGVVPSVKGQGLISAYKRTGRMIPQAGGAYQSTIENKIQNAGASNVKTYVSKMLRSDSGKMGFKAISGNHFAHLTTCSFEDLTFSFDHVIVGKEDDYLALGEEERQNVAAYEQRFNAYILEKTISKKPIDIENQFFQKKLRESRDDISNKIIASKNHALRRLAFESARRSLSVEGMITSQHIYFFGENNAKPAYTSYTPRIGNASILRIRRTNIGGLEQDMADHLAERTKEVAQPQHLEIFVGTDFTSKEQRGFAQNWLPLNRVK